MHAAGLCASSTMRATVKEGERLGTTCTSTRSTGTGTNTSRNEATTAWQSSLLLVTQCLCFPTLLLLLRLLLLLPVLRRLLLLLLPVLLLLLLLRLPVLLLLRLRLRKEWRTEIMSTKVIHMPRRKASRSQHASASIFATS